MPKKLAVHFECERCPRSWFDDYEDGQEMPESTSLVVKMSPPDGKVTEINFGVLCKSCTTTVQNYIEKIGKVESKSPKRGAKKEDSEESPEVTVSS